MRKLLISLAVVAIIAVVCLFVAKPRPRIFYKPEVITESHRLQAYSESRRSGAAWTRDPSEVALLLVEGCNRETNAGSDCGNLTRVAVFPLGEKRAAVVLLDDPIRSDDSIAGEEWRLDFVRATDHAWDLEWSGERWRCQREIINVWTRFFRCS